MHYRTGVRTLRDLLENLGSPEQYLFSLTDLAPVFAALSRPALKMLLSRAVDDGLLQKVCRGLYLYPKVKAPGGMLLYHAAAKLRAGTFNYISLESALSDYGVISQVPMQWLTVMSGGRSSTFDCGRWGTIEFIHTFKTPDQLAGVLLYDERARLWRAPVSLALKDMKACGRSLDLVDWSAADEFV